MVQKFPHQITSYAILIFEKGNDSVAFFLHCLGGPARTGHPGRCRARCSAHLRTPTLRHRRSPPAAEGPEKFSNSPGLTQKWLGRRGRRPPGPSLRPRGQSEKSPEKAPRPRQTCSLQSCCPRPRTSGGQGATRPKSGAPRRHEGRGRAPILRDGAGRPVGFRSLLLIRPNTTRQRRSATHPPAGQSRTAEAWRPSVRSRCPRPDTQPQTCSFSRPRARLGTRKEGCGPAGGAEGRGCGASPGLQRAGGTAWTPQPRSLVQHPGNGGLGGVCRPGEGARRGGRATAAAPIGPGSRPSARATAPSGDAPPRLVRLRPEGSSALPVSRTSQPGGAATSGAPGTSGTGLDLCCRPQGRRPPSATQTPATPGPERGVGLGQRGPSCEEGWPQVGPRSRGTSSSPRGKVGGQQETVLFAGALLSPLLVDPEGPVRVRRTEVLRPLGLLPASWVAGPGAPLPRSWQTPQAPAVADLCLEVFYRLPVRVPTEIILYLHRCPF